MNFNKVNVIDFEMLCWDREADPDNTMVREIIQIGIVELDLSTYTVTREAEYLCKPVMGGMVTDYCTKLTGITQSQINKQRTLLEVIRTLQRKFGVSNKPWVSWGQDNLALLNDLNSKLSHDKVSDYTFAARHIDFALLWNIIFGASKQTSLTDAMDSFDLKFEGTQHTALADAYNTAQLFCKFMQRIHS